MSGGVSEWLHGWVSGGVRALLTVGIIKAICELSGRISIEDATAVFCVVLLATVLDPGSCRHACVDVPLVYQEV